MSLLWHGSDPDLDHDSRWWGPEPPPVRPAWSLCLGILLTVAYMLLLGGLAWVVKIVCRHLAHWVTR